MSDRSPLSATYETLAQLAALCYGQGVRCAVLSPGSRCAPVALSFMRHPKITHHILTDERSAAYTALGMAQASRRPVVLVCTSGTAALNYAPAVAEAYFQEVPLVVLTTDRPAELIGQADNQAIRQRELYGKHSRFSAELPLDLTGDIERQYVYRLINEALNTAAYPTAGPVHVNIPLREPLYLPEPVEVPEQPAATVIRRHRPFMQLVEADVLEELADAINRDDANVLLIAGLMPPDAPLQAVIRQTAGQPSVRLLADTASNLAHLPEALTDYDRLLRTEPEFGEALKTTDLTLIFGGPVVSKRLKQALRAHPPKRVVYIHPGAPTIDTYRALTDLIQCRPADFFRQLNAYLPEETVVKRRPRPHFELPAGSLTEAAAMRYLLGSLPEDSVLHLGNSKIIRLAEGYLPEHELHVFANRGTSGIDGSLSAAVGNAMISERRTYAILGDLSFLYDSNALFNNDLPDNLRIIVFNNHGGGIFKLIDGPKQQAELDELFVTRQPRRAEGIARQFGCGYRLCTAAADLPAALAESEAARTCTILEIEFID